MKKTILTALAAIFLSFAAPAQNDALLDKARRAYSNGEWASATALYGVYCDREPGLTEAYARRMLASELIADTITSTAVIEEAMHAEVGAPALFAAFRASAFETGHPEAFPTLLKRARGSLSWLARPIDAALLDFYKFRNNPAQTEEYARTLLAGLPDDTGYLATLAESLLMQVKNKDALVTYARILEIDPRDFDALVSLGTYWLDEGDTAKARDYLTRAAEIRTSPALRQTLDRLGK